MPRFRFGEFELDTAAGRLTRASEPLAMPARHLDVLAALLARAGEVVSKDALVEAAWPDVAVTDNSLEQAISAPAPDARLAPAPRLIETGAAARLSFQPRRSTRLGPRNRRALDALLAPHRAWLEGRAALESARARSHRPRRAGVRGRRCAVPDRPRRTSGSPTLRMQFEMTRADRRARSARARRAVHHAREACRLDAHYGEAWATLGFVLDRIGQPPMPSPRPGARSRSNPTTGGITCVSPRAGARSVCARRAGRLHSCRGARWPIGSRPPCTWRASRSTKRSARWWRARVPVGTEAGGAFPGVALEWLHGLLYLARGDEAARAQHFDRELAAEAAGHLYARECCANMWYAIGAMRWRRGNRVGAREAFAQALQRVPPSSARVDRVAGGGSGYAPPAASLEAASLKTRSHMRPSTRPPSGGIDAALANAVALAFSGERAERGSCRGRRAGVVAAGQWRLAPCRSSRCSRPAARNGDARVRAPAQPRRLTARPAVLLSGFFSSSLQDFRGGARRTIRIWEVRMRHAVIVVMCLCGIGRRVVGPERHRAADVRPRRSTCRARDSA